MVSNLYTDTLKVSKIRINFPSYPNFAQDPAKERE